MNEIIDYEKEVIENLMRKRFISLPRIFIKEFGPTTSIYLYNLIEWRDYLQEYQHLSSDKPFFITRDKIREKTFLSDERQSLSLKKLVEKGIIIVERGGIRNRNNYKIDFKALYDLIKKPLESPVNGKYGESKTHSLEMDSVDVKYPHSINKTILKSYNETEHSLRNDRPDGLSYNKTPSLLIRRNTNSIEFQPKQYTYRKDVMSVISYWNNSPGLPRLHTPNDDSGRIPSKSFLQILNTIAEVIDGKFLQAWPSYSVEDIIKAIDGFKIRFTNPDYSPANKSTLKGINLTTLFWNPYSSYIQSMFLECLNNPPILLKNTVVKEKELNPQLTVWLQQFYTDKVLLGQPKVFNQVEINKFIKGSNLLISSMTNLRKRANLLTGPMEFCEYTVDALLNQFPREQIQIGNISSEWTYTELLPRYLGKLGRID